MFEIELRKIETNFTGETCFTHARAAMTPDGFAVMTTQPLRLSGSDIYYGLHELTSRDKGRNWSAIRPVRELSRRPFPGGDGWEIAMADATPLYHRATGTFLLTGASMLYCDDEFVPPPRPRHTLYSTMDPATGNWSEYKVLDMPEDPEGNFFACAAGCTQYLELDNGELLIPVYTMNREEALDPWHNSYRAAVMRCGFDGKSLRVLECGSFLTTPVPRGFCEPSIAGYGGRYFLTLRNDEAGFVATGADGLHYSAPVEWRFDDGEPLGNYNTQQHWITGGGRLYLVYTRRAGNNDHIFRHRAPLFIAEVDPERLRVIRSTERIAVPERGARLGNFGCCRISDRESWIVASEWMQSPGPLGPENLQRCLDHGSDNSIFIARILF
ncbi:sialidase family protein [uncultured Victivallis sp.]|uniref:sialidase family protein n=1 Tax=uncultured Victivallis sp. TaxID=354118 RepID=UPI0025CC6B7A|nr:sialidase family protein [uncultured Victivallis sp.]